MKHLLAQLDELKAQIAALSVSQSEKDTLLRSIDAALGQATSCEETQADLIFHAQKADFLEASLDALPNPIFMKNADGAFVYFNSAYQTYFGMDRATYLGKTVLDLDFLPPDERARYQEEDLNLIQSGNVKHYEKSFTLPGGEVSDSLYWSKGFSVANGNNKGLVGEIVDITLQNRLKNEILKNAEELAHANERIARLMKEDTLTGLYNRRALDDLVADVIRPCPTPAATLSILMADLDRFKIVNDTYGHAIGDKILIAFSQILLDCTRKDDYVIRFGGEEFLVLLFNTPLERAREVAERIRALTEETLLLPNGKTNTVSIGTSTLFEGEAFTHCIERADEALYYAKNNGRNQVF